MATDKPQSALPGCTRRHCLLALGSGAVLPGAWAATPDPATLLAAWESGNQYQVGLVRVSNREWNHQLSVTVPTRPHGLLAEPGGTALVVARRPGDWLLRWRPGDNRQQWQWIDGDRRFNGHVIAGSQRLWTTETDLASAQGCLGVRDTQSLEKVDEWATHGMDPHELLALPSAVGPFPAGTLLVANGGIPTLPETGRSKHQLDRMDPSLVALHPETGELLGQWRLSDPFLSIRHLAWDGAHARLGIALQAEHPAAEDRRLAPVLATWDGHGLTTSPHMPDFHHSPDLRGYGGAVASVAGGGFLVGCPRADVVAQFDSDGRWERNLAMPNACPVAVSGEWWWAGGSLGVLQTRGSANNASSRLITGAASPRWDNHWQVWPGP